MLKLKADGKDFEIPNHWSEVTLQQWQAIERATTDNEVAEALCGFPVSNGTLANLQPFLLWLAVPFQKTDWQLPNSITVDGKEVRLPINIRQKEWAQKIILQQLKPEEFLMAIAVYLQPLVEGVPFDYERAEAFVSKLSSQRLSTLHSLAINLQGQLEKVLTIEAKEISSPPTPEQKQAGIAMFDKFGVNNTIDALAGGDVLKYEAVLRVDYDTIFLKLKRHATEAKFNRAYARIMRKKQLNNEE